MITPLKVLILEDREADAELMAYELRRAGFQPQWQRVDNQEDYARSLQEDIHIILADYNLPQFNAVQALQHLQETGLDIPFIVVTGSISEEVAVSIMKQGAADYLIKDRLTRLGQAVLHAIEQKQNRQEKRLAELALRSSEERHRVISETVSDYAYALQIDPQGKIAIDWVSGAFTRITGYTIEEIQMRGSWPMIIHREDQQILEDRLRKFRQGQEDISEFRILTKDGQTRWLRDYSRPVLGKDGQNILCIYGASQDITERKQRERALEAIAAVSDALRLATTRAQMIPVILDQVINLFNAQGAAIETVDPSTHKLVIELGRGAWISAARLNKVISSQLSSRVLSSTQVYLVNKRNSINTPVQPDNDDCTSIAGIPLMVEQNAIGLLWLGRTVEITPADLNVLTSIANIAANAIHRASLHERTVLQLERLNALRTIDIAISTQEDLRAIMNILLEQVARLLQVDATSILLFDPNTQTLRYGAGLGFRLPGIQLTNLHIGEGYAGNAASQRRLIHVPDLREQDEGTRQSVLLEGEDFITHYSLPLITNDQIKGVLEVFHRSPLQAGKDWLEFFEAIAGQAAIAIDKIGLFNQLQKTNRELIQAYEATLEGWSQALDLRDRETQGHTERVTQLTLELARRFAFAEEDLVHIRRGALLHDIGKMGIPDSILHKPGPLNEAEWQIMHRHPVYAYQMLEPIEYLRPALVIPYGHHENWDGSGYPRGLSGEQIPLAARIFAIIDVWDALTSDRPYRLAWPKERVTEYILEQSGKKFDPQVVTVFLDLLQSP